MPRIMPPLATTLAVEVDNALALAAAGEIVRASATPGSAAWREVRRKRLEALYEMAYLGLFIAWEIFLEETMLRLLCGYLTAQGAVGLRQPVCRTSDDERIAVLGGQHFVSWADAVRVEQRAQ